MSRIKNILEEMVAIASMMDAQPIYPVGAVTVNKESKGKKYKKPKEKGTLK